MKWIRKPIHVDQSQAKVRPRRVNCYQYIGSHCQYTCVPETYNKSKGAATVTLGEVHDIFRGKTSLQSPWAWGTMISREGRVATHGSGSPGRSQISCSRNLWIHRLYMRPNNGFWRPKYMLKRRGLLEAAQSRWHRCKPFFSYLSASMDLFESLFPHLYCAFLSINLEGC